MQSPDDFKQPYFEPVPSNLLNKKQGRDEKQSKRGDLSAPGKVAVKKPGTTLGHEIGKESAKTKDEPAKYKANILASFPVI